MNSATVATVIVGMMFGVGCASAPPTARTTETAATIAAAMPITRAPAPSARASTDLGPKHDTVAVSDANTEDDFDEMPFYRPPATDERGAFASLVRFIRQISQTDEEASAKNVPSAGR